MLAGLTTAFSSRVLPAFPHHGRDLAEWSLARRGLGAYLDEPAGTRRILEVGPGTGAVTRRLPRSSAPATTSTWSSSTSSSWHGFGNASPTSHRCELWRTRLGFTTVRSKTCRRWPVRRGRFRPAAEQLLGRAGPTDPLAADGLLKPAEPFPSSNTSQFGRLGPCSAGDRSANGCTGSAGPWTGSWKERSTATGFGSTCPSLGSPRPRLVGWAEFYAAQRMRIIHQGRRQTLRTSACPYHQGRLYLSKLCIS